MWWIYTLDASYTELKVFPVSLFCQAIYSVITFGYLQSFVECNTLIQVLLQPKPRHLQLLYVRLKLLLFLLRQVQLCFASLRLMPLIFLQQVPPFFVRTYLLFLKWR